jgi:hypothetical protein
VLTGRGSTEVIGFYKQQLVTAPAATFNFKITSLCFDIKKQAGNLSEYPGIMVQIFIFRGTVIA